MEDHNVIFVGLGHCGIHVTTSLLDRLYKSLRPPSKGVPVSPALTRGNLWDIPGALRGPISPFFRVTGEYHEKVTARALLVDDSPAAMETIAENRKMPWSFDPGSCLLSLPERQTASGNFARGVHCLSSLSDAAVQELLDGTREALPVVVMGTGGGCGGSLASLVLPRLRDAGRPATAMVVYPGMMGEGLLSPFNALLATAGIMEACDVIFYHSLESPRTTNKIHESEDVLLPVLFPTSPSLSKFPNLQNTPAGQPPANMKARSPATIEQAMLPLKTVADKFGAGRAFPSHPFVSTQSWTVPKRTEESEAAALSVDCLRYLTVHCYLTKPTQAVLIVRGADSPIFSSGAWQREAARTLTERTGTTLSECLIDPRPLDFIHFTLIGRDDSFKAVLEPIWNQCAFQLRTHRGSHQLARYGINEDDIEETLEIVKSRLMLDT